VSLISQWVGTYESVISQCVIRCVYYIFQGNSLSCFSNLGQSQVTHHIYFISLSPSYARISGLAITKPHISSSCRSFGKVMIVQRCGLICWARSYFLFLTQCHHFILHFMLLFLCEVLKFRSSLNIAWISASHTQSPILRSINEDA
jgi:hypothetical protein